MSAVVWATVHRGCALPAPEAAAPPQLRALGDFGQPYAAGDDRSLEDAAVAIGSNLDRNLLGSSAAGPVHESAPDDRHHDATVVALRSVLRRGDQPRVVGVVVFLDDCDGRHYFVALHDLTPGRDPVSLATDYPAVSASEAAGRLETSAPVLSYAADPAQPVWRNPTTGGTVPAQ